MYKIAKLLIAILFISNGIIAQEINQNRKKMEATRVESPPKIDGALDDTAWNNVPIAKDFVMMRPDNGKKESDTHKTEVKLVYDDNAIYVSAKMYTPDTSKIPAEFTTRDNIGNADFFMFMVNPNDDGQNPFAFIVTASGVQVDFKVSNGGNEDWNWSAVWDSSHKINDTNWVVEMKIPYRAIRFANEPIQSWGINFHREVRNLNARYTWNLIDNKQGSWTQYDGLVENFKNIKPPTRLSFYPYASATTTTFEGNTDFDWSVGMDVKYGITENFTLDATLIPDFSQVGFDNVTLNLGPFEQQFSEQRQFFTEGTELFGKGNLFYSRRIGAAPIDQFAGERKNDKEFIDGIKINDELVNAPDKVQMLNAIKISGRTKKGLGIGFFNAITEKTDATVKRTKLEIDELTNEVDTITSNYNTTINPFSNYNIMVLDQQFNQNSSVSLINTNVTRDGRFRDANATGLLWHIEDKKSTYNIDGSVRMTNISDDADSPNTGYSFDTSIGKHAGNWFGEIGYRFENKDFDIDDLGFLWRNNQQRIYNNVGYRILKPKGIFNEYLFNFWQNANFMHESGIFTHYRAGLHARFFTKKRFSFGFNANYTTKEKDYYEPRQGATSSVFFERPSRIFVNHWASSDYRKKLAVDYDFFYSFFKNNPKFNYGFRVSPRYRFNNQFSLVYAFRYRSIENDQGYINQIDEDDVSENTNYAPLLDEIIFGQRDWTTYDNSLTGKYSFSTKSSLSLSFRHNWSKVPYENQFYTLDQNNGELVANNYNDSHDRNFNSWNLDVNYVWQFAPGSQLIAFYRNSIFSSSDNAKHDFFKNLDNLFEQENKHTFSVRLVYFIDYNDFKNIF